MSDKTYKIPNPLVMTKEMWEDGVATGREKAKKDYEDFIRDTIDGKRHPSPRFVDVEMPKQGLNCIYKGTEEYRKAIAKAFDIPKSYMDKPKGSKWEQMWIDEADDIKNRIKELKGE